MVPRGTARYDLDSGVGSRLPPDRRSAKMEPKTVSVPEAGRWLGISRNASYEAARRGEIPTIRIGRLLRVPIVALERKLEEVGR